MQTFRSMGEAVADAMDRNARAAAQRAASDVNGAGNCGLCGQSRAEPTTVGRLCAHHPGDLRYDV